MTTINNLQFDRMQTLQSQTDTMFLVHWRNLTVPHYELLTQESHGHDFKNLEELPARKILKIKVKAMKPCAK